MVCHRVANRVVRSLVARGLVGTRLVVSCLALWALGSSAALAQGVADFYAGRQISLVIGTGPGGGYDTYGRLLARYLGKYIPGHPAIVVQNMPGAGGLKAANYLYAVAPRDGTVIGTISHDLPLVALSGANSGIKFDPRKFTWLGSPSSVETDAYLLMVRSGMGIASAADARREGGPALTMGATADGSGVLMRDVLGLKVRLIAGYPDSNALFLAVDRKEIDARMVGLSTMRSNHPEWLDPASGMRPILQFARVTRHPQFADVPTARELARTDRERAIIELAEQPFLLQRPYLAPPDLPEDRARALQSAFMEVHKDAEYLADAAKLNLEISPVDGASVVRSIDRILTFPPDVLGYFRTLHGNGKGE